jgi:hypothetical protein
MIRFVLWLRYIFGGLISIVAIMMLFEQKLTQVKFIVEFIIGVLLLVPPSLKLNGQPGILARKLKPQQFFRPYILFALCRWVEGLFYSIGAIAHLESKEYVEGGMMLLLGFTLISPIDRFFFPRVSFSVQNKKDNSVTYIYLLRNSGIFLVFIALVIYNLNKPVACCMLIIGVGCLLFSAILALKKPAPLMPAVEQVSADASSVLATDVTPVRATVTITETLTDLMAVVRKLLILPVPDPSIKRHKTPKYHNAYVMQWKLKSSNINDDYFQQLIKHFQNTWLAANEYRDRLKMHRREEEYKEQIILLLTDYIEEIRRRPQMNDKLKVDAVPDQIREIWKADKRLRSLFCAMKRYSEQRGSKRIWIIIVHIAEYRAMINLVKMIKHSQVRVVPVLIKRSQEALLQTDLYRNTEKVTVLNMDTYFQIIDYIILLGKNLENYKDLNDKFNEERYRDYFLPFLNAVNPAYSAKGEVFNRLGKTDILVCDSNGNNIFIAECKLWHGEAYLMNAVNQLLNNYVNWRDEKTAIIIFNREMRQFSQLILTATEAIMRHPLCLHAVGKRSDASWSYLFRHPDDNNSVIRLELVLFNFA